MSHIETKKPSLPNKVLKDIKQSLAQANRGETVSHADAMKQIRAWRKR
jgi:predicted transcriptional regulator